MIRIARFCLFGSATLCFLVAPLWSKFGVNKTHARFSIYHPPAFLTPQRQLRLEVGSVDMRTGFLMVPRLQHFLEEAMVSQGFKISPGARTKLECTLTDASAGLETVQRSESVNIHLGEHTEEKNGKKKEVEDCKSRDVRVTYLISSGHLAMEVKAKDAQTLLMSRMVERSYRQESAIAGPPKCGGEAYNVQREQLQDPSAILGQLGDEAVSDTVALAAGFDEPRDVLLAVDDELKPGNTQAQAGAWPEALETWTNAAMHSTPGEAARQYNLGVAHEVMGAAAMHNWALDEAANHFAQAQECYSTALKTDPNEKYFRDTMGRLEMDRGLLHQQLNQASQEQAASGGATPRRGPPPTSSLSIPMEGWPDGEAGPVHDYRVYVRTRLSAQKSRPADALRQQLIAAAGDYGVQNDTALQVLDSETQRLDVVRKNMEQYRQDFAAAVAGGSVSPDEREMLRKRQQILHLSDDQVREIEAQFQARPTDR